MAWWASQPKSCERRLVAPAWTFPFPPSLLLLSTHHCHTYMKMYTKNVAAQQCCCCMRLFLHKPRMYVFYICIYSGHLVSIHPAAAVCVCVRAPRVFTLKYVYKYHMIQRCNRCCVFTCGECMACQNVGNNCSTIQQLLYPRCCAAIVVCQVYDCCMYRAVQSALPTASCT